MTTRNEKIRTAVARFNMERATKGLGYKFRGRNVVGFTPCEKSLVFLAALPGARIQDALSQPPYNRISEKSVLSEIENLAALVTCECHPAMTANQIMEYEYAN